jgi:type II secretory pathway pseudopilin PulG
MPIAIFTGFFAFPWSRDQPTEIWALAKIRFLLKPRRRIWDQSGTKELVTVTAPKVIQEVYTNGLSQTEVTSRLHALADTIDSRGWSIKNVNLNLYSQPALIMNEPASDRLIAVSALPQAVPDDDITASDDILDEENSAVSQKFDSMIAASTKAHRAQIMERMQKGEATKSSPPSQQPAAAQPAQPAQPANNYWFLNQPSQATASVPNDAVTFNAQVITPGAPATDLPVPSATPTSDEEQLIKELEQNRNSGVNAYSHLHTVVPLSARPKPVSAPNAQPPKPVAATTPLPTPPVTPPPNAAILNLARNDDLNVATIAHEAHKRTQPPDDEVVISLH